MLAISPPHSRQRVADHIERADLIISAHARDIVFFFSKARCTRITKRAKPSAPGRVKNEVVRCKNMGLGREGYDCDANAVRKAERLELVLGRSSEARWPCTAKANTRDWLLSTEDDDVGETKLQ